MNALLALTMASSVAAAEPARPLRYESFQEGHVYYHAVVADLSSDLVVAEAQYAPGKKNVWKMIAEKQPAAAITGTFFGMKTGIPVADVVIDGQLVAKGHIGSAIGVDWFGKVKLFDTGYRSNIDWYGYRYLLRGAIRLISEGKVNPNPKAQHFTDAGLWGKAPRTGVGLTQDNELVLMATTNRVTLSQFGNSMKQLGVSDAIALDGGGSTMLYYRGSLVVPPKRDLSTIFILHERGN